MTDVVVIGSGIAAAALVRRILRARPKAEVLILEAGSRVKMRDFALYQHYVVTGELPYSNFYDLAPPARGQAGENRFTGDLELSLQGARLMMYGGTTVHWDGYSFRFKPEDFRLHSNTGNGIDWPFEYEELEPWYCEAEAFIGVAGDSADTTVPRSEPYPFKAFPYSLEDTLAIEAFERLGISYSHLPIARQGVDGASSTRAPCQTTGSCLYCPFGAVYNAANDLDQLASLQHHPGLAIRTDAVVERIMMDGKARASGVEVLDKTTGERRVVEAGIVVVASGTIESPKLLQRSVTPEWKNGVGNDNDLVGRNIVTHPWITFGATLPANPLRLQPEMAFPTLVSRHFDTPQEQAHGKYLIVNPSGTPGVDLAGLMQAGKSRAEIVRKIGGPVPISINAMFEVFSQHHYRVTNLDKPNHLGLPQSLIHFESTGTIKARLKSLHAQAETIFAEMGAKGPVSMDVSWGAHHATCTTRMSDSPELGVVDADLRVHGVDNLYVCSNASFSTLSAINPTLTLTALSLRLGEHLGRRLEHA